MKLKDIGAKNDMPRGWVKDSIIHSKIYEMWRGVLRRSFCRETDNNYKWYKDCTCHPDFLLLSNFVKWIEKEPNYPLLVEDPGCNKWTIDKDSIVPGNKEYTPDKIRLVTRSENSSERIRRDGHPMQSEESIQKYIKTKSMAIIGINIIDNSIVYFTSMNNANRMNNFNTRHISAVCKGVRKTHKGYKWFYATDLLGVMNYLRGY